MMKIYKRVCITTLVVWFIFVSAFVQWPDIERYLIIGNYIAIVVIAIFMRYFYNRLKEMSKPKQ